MEEFAPRMLRAAFASAVVAFFGFFLYYTAGGLDSWFSNDDLMNLHNSLARIVLNASKDDFYFEAFPAPRLLLEMARPWGDVDRPVGLLFYRAIYEAWGFSPLPFRVAAFSLLSLNLALLVVVCREVSGSRAATLVALCLTGLHASFVSIYYDTGMIFDVLAFSLYFGVVWIYVRRRRQGSGFGVGGTVLLAMMALAAIGSKEIALSLPVALVVYEWLWHPAQWRQWVRGPARTALWTLALVVVVVVAKLAGVGLLRTHAAYQPRISMQVYLASCGHYLTLWTYGFRTLGANEASGVLVVVALVSLILKCRALRWCGVMIFASLLPLAFIPPRAGYAFYLPAVFWALWVACLLVEIHRRLRLPPAARWALPVVAAAALLPLHARMFDYPLRVVHDVQNANRAYHDQLLQVLPKVKPGARILVTNDPYPADGFDASFLIRLTYEDMTLRIDRTRFPWLAKRSFQRGDYDVVLDFVDGRWVMAQ